MKKHFTKKLALNKRTVTNLNNTEMNQVQGQIDDRQEERTGPRSRCICADTDLCPTTNLIICNYTCDSCGVTVCGSNPCC